MACARADASESLSRGLARQKGLRGLIPRELAAGMGEEVQARRPAAGHKQRVASDPAAGPHRAPGNWIHANR